MELRSRAASVTCKVNCRYIHCEPTSITVLRRPRQLSDRLESRSGSIAERFWIQRRQWHEARDPIRSTRPEWVSVNGDRVPVAKERVGPTEDDREARMLKNFEFENSNLKFQSRIGIGNR